jgi:hypothetical protein
MSEPRPSNNPLHFVGTILGAASGWLFSWYCGASIWIPGASAVLLMVLFAKSPLKPKHFAGAIAATAGHLAWFLAGAFLSQNWIATGLDIAALAIGIVWIWLRPGLGSVAFLGVIQLLSLALNAVALTEASFGSLEHRALTAHVLFRVIALSCLAVGYWHLKKQASTQAPAPAPTVATPPSLPESRGPEA